MNYSGVVPLPELDLFSMPPKQFSIEKDYVTEHRSLSSLSSAHSIEIQAQTAIDEYIKLAESDLYVRIKVKTTSLDATKMPRNFDGIGVSNNTLNTLFSNVRISIGNNEVTFNSNNHHYRSYFDYVFGSDDVAKKTHLSVAGFTWPKSDNSDFTTRNVLRTVTGTPTSGYVTYEFIGKLSTDLTNQMKAILGGAHLKIELIPNKPEIVLRHLSTVDNAVTSSYEFEDVCLYLHKAKVTPHIIEAHNKALARPSVQTRYPVSHTEVKSFVVNKGVSEWSNDNVILGQLPRRLFVAVLPSDAYNGTFKTDPFEFSHNNVNYVATYVNGVPYPSRPLTPDFVGNKYSKEYLSLLENLNLDKPSNHVNITRTMFKDSFAIYCFNYSPDMAEGGSQLGHISDAGSGALRLQIKFNPETTKNLNVLVLAEFDNMIFIDANRKGYNNFNVIHS